MGNPIFKFKYMILILSTPTDLDTQNVIDWLVDYNATFFRLNDEDLLNGNVEFYYDLYDESQTYFRQDNRKVFLKDISIVWFRKFGFLKSYEKVFNRRSDITRYLYTEFSVMRSIIFNLLDHKKWLYRKQNMPTKLEVLKVANDCGLNIPKTKILSNKKSLDAFFESNNKNVLTKSLGEGKHVDYDNANYPFFTKKIENTNGILEKFSPTLFQNYVDKILELRVFYLDGDCYSMAIFSQNNPKTKIDFRSYDLDNPTRYVPYSLPNNMKVRINNMMNKLGLNTGSIDMIHATDNKYYFLEVNPAGQFGMTSTPCNYNLHKKVAHYLYKKAN